MTTTPSDRAPLALTLPLAGLTAIGLLATDLYLPAVPTLPRELGGDITLAQATLASFMLTLALSQLLWGGYANRHGERAALLRGALLLCAGSLLCALAPDMALLIAGRALQGLGAGAATVAVPALLRKRCSETQAVDAMSLVGIAESLVPALGPLAGAAVIHVAGWRATFWIVLALTIVVLPVVVKTIPREEQRAVVEAGGYRGLLRNRAFLRYALSHGLMFGGLLMFVASAPNLMSASFGLPIASFIVLQLCGVGAFIAFAANAARIVRRAGARAAIVIGVALQLAGCVLLVVIGWWGLASIPAAIAGWALFCAGLGVRGPVVMTRALTAAGGDAAKGSGLLMFMAFSIAALATLLVAPSLAGGMLPLGGALLAMTALSALLLVA
ncbi:MAG TPA: MFS transporter, partial [Burkholderiaceae bacterium]